MSKYNADKIYVLQHKTEGIIRILCENAKISELTSFGIGWNISPYFSPNERNLNILIKNCEYKIIQEWK